MYSNIEFIFMHIEKCMGCSLEFMFINYFNPLIERKYIYSTSYPEENIISTNNNNNNHYDNINTEKYNIKIFLGHIFYKSNLNYCIFNKAFCVTSIRNPIDRIISHYYYFLYPNYNKQLHQLNNEEIYAVLQDCGNVTTWRLLGGIEIDPENLNDQYIVSMLIDKVKEFNCILIQENIDIDLIKLNQILNNKYNFKNNFELLSENKTNYNTEFNKKMDCEFLKKFESYFYYDLTIYNFVISMSIDERIKL